MELPVQPYFTISGLLLLQQYQKTDIAIDESVQLNILLDTDLSHLAGLFSVLTKIKNGFLFSVPVSVACNDNILRELLPACYLLFSLDNYSRIENIIPVLPDQPGDPASIRADIIRNYFKTQGVESLGIPILNHDTTVINASAACSYFIYTITGNNIDEAAFSGVSLIGFANPINDLSAFNTSISHLKLNPGIASVPVNHLEKKLHEQEIQHWQQRTLLYRNFLTLSKSVQQKEYYEVLDWYHKEYEALPRWYKQFGHIIKVITGKRSFRSLFHSNNKKHKD